MNYFEKNKKNLFANTKLKEIFEECLEENKHDYQAFTAFLLKEIIPDFINCVEDYNELLTDGSGDGGIDAFHYNESEEEVYILQDITSKIF